MKSCPRIKSAQRFLQTPSFIRYLLSKASSSTVVFPRVLKVAVCLAKATLVVVPVGAGSNVKVQLTPDTYYLQESKS